MRVVAIIPAKGNSRRLPKKNIYPVWGKPMLYWAIKACEESKYNIEPWISTEDSEVEEVAKSFGAKIHRRDLELSDSKTYKQAVIRSAAGYISFIRAEHLDNAIDVLLKHERHEVFSVDNNLMQNAAFRIFKGDYVFQEDLSTNCGVVVCDLHDVHTIEDVRYLEK